ncbi:hypothetical protein CRE_12392 [Caenorhabditis remanei]|uniref:Uncharacterized protein n=1 Tax=Caenorhabditis remanei TaxID=31234 RepID=E3NN98_CAERE|nr:hypothetical protein CRE_12392 [Caenorhabditis remanei]
MYGLLSTYSSASQVMIEFSGNDASADYTTVTWLDPCYREFYSNAANKYVVFWYKEDTDTVYCEAVSMSKSKTPRFPVENLMRVERLGDRCA